MEFPEFGNFLLFSKSKISFEFFEFVLEEFFEVKSAIDKII
jgi:hypothetical protein